MTTVRTITLITILGSWLMLQVLGYDRQQIQNELNVQKEKWQRQNIQNYNYKFERYGDPTKEVYPFSSQVRNGVQVSYVNGNDEPITWLKKQTLDSYFKLIQDQLNSNAQEISVSYSKRGFPEYLYIVMADGTVFNVRIFDFNYARRFMRRRGLTQSNGLQDLALAESVWKSKGMDNYEYQYRMTGPNPENIVYPLTVTVRNGVQASAIDGNNNPIFWQPPVPHPMVVEELFAWVYSVYSTNDSIAVTYNSIYGYPEVVAVDYNAGNARYTAQIYNLQAQ